MNAAEQMIATRYQSLRSMFVTREGIPMQKSGVVAHEAARMT
jgi:hypothetical protein